VEVGAATATANATAIQFYERLLYREAAAASWKWGRPPPPLMPPLPPPPLRGGAITGDTITFGNGGGDFVLVDPTATATATADPSGNSMATTSATANPGDIALTQSNSGMGTATSWKTATSTADPPPPSAGNATASATAIVIGGGTITYDTITFGNGAGDFVQLDPVASSLATTDASATDTATATSGASSTVNVVPNIVLARSDQISCLVGNRGRSDVAYEVLEAESGSARRVDLDDASFHPYLISNRLSPRGRRRAIRK
jgi:hypothetical protein